MPRANSLCVDILGVAKHPFERHVARYIHSQLPIHTGVNFGATMATATHHVGGSYSHQSRFDIDQPRGMFGKPPHRIASAPSTLKHMSP
jgi:hypothetical protein